MIKRLSALVGVALILAGAVLYQASQPKPVLAQRHFRPIAFDKERYEPQRVLGALPPIVGPPFVTASEATHLQPSELVLGVEIDGVARAYPINTLTGPRREIFNDQLGEHAIAATW